jgi:glyoxylase-like metal-dependent hydrolase (beta-lactamase superfamily II)
MMVNLPGHTDGLCGVIVRNGEEYVLLASDAAVSPRSWEKMEPPGYAADYKLQYKTLRWIAEMSKDPGCAGVLCSHDPDPQQGQTTVTI